MCWCKYKYVNPNFTTEGATLDPDEIANVKVAAALIKNIPGFELHKDLKDIIRKLEMQAGIEDDEEQVIQFDTRLGYSGNKHLTRLFEAITCKQVIRFRYKDFQEKKESEVTLHPYLLKEFNNRWSLIGVTENSRKERKYEVSRYGLERIIEKVKPADGIEYYKHYDFDPDTYLKDIIGVSLNAGDTIEDVVLKFSEKRAPYIETNPLHQSQNLVPKTKTTYSFQLIPNKELEALILFFGSDVEVLEPVSLRARIATLTLDASKKYL
jgi:predicted DNA-binding transcriptional regulator YafY